MNLNVSKRSNDRIYLSINQSYRDSVTKKSRTKVIRSVGYLDELEKEYDDPISHFKEVARKMTEEEREKKHVTLSFSMDEELAPDASGRKNYGYAAIMKIYHELLLHEFLASKARYQKFEFNTNSIMLLLVISRILSPGSKRKAFDERERYFERFDFTLADTYRALSHFAKIESDVQKFLHEQITRTYGRDTSIVYFDATNFYFEIDEPDDLRKRGVSKEHRPNPIVQMGLAMDRDGVPISYKLFPGNKHDSETFKGVIGDICRNYEAGRIIVVGDMGMITGDNIWYLIGGKPSKPMHGYVFSFSVRGGTNEFKEYVLSKDGYSDSKGKPASDDTEYKIKTRMIARKIDVTRARDAKKMKKTVYEKQVVFWSAKYAERAKAEREVSLKKALAFIKNPSKYSRHINHGSAKYIKGIDKETGEVSPDQLLSLDFEVLREEEKYDGYYAIVTSEHKMDDEQIIATYRGLWEIEETFRVAKGELEARPVFVSRQDRIDAHFLTCFIALIIVRILQKKTGRVFSSEKIIECLNRISCSNEQGNIYLYDYRSDISDAIATAVGVDFTKKRLRLGEIKKSLGGVKK
jgi:transposase